MKRATVQPISEQKTFAAIRLLVGAASLVIVVAGLREGRAILAPFMFAVLVSIAGLGPVLWLRKRRVPGPIAAVIVTSGIGVALFATGSLLTSSVSELLEALPRYQVSFMELIGNLESWALKRGLELPHLYSEVNAQATVNMAGNLLGGIFRSFSSAATATVFVVFILFEAAEFQTKFRHALGGAVDVNRLERVTSDVQRYLVVKTITSFITGFLVWTMVVGMGLDLSILWGLLAFLLNYIPVVGSIIAAIPAILLAMIQLGWLATAVIATGYAIVNISVSNFLEPTLMGRQLGLSPLVVFLSLVFWGWLWGPIGMLLSVPITMLVKILLENSDDLQWVAVLMEAPRDYGPGLSSAEGQPVEEETGSQPRQNAAGGSHG